MPAILHVQDEAFIGEMGDSDYREIMCGQYEAISVSISPPYIIGWSYLLSTSWLHLDKKHLSMLEDTNWIPTGLELGKCMNR